MDRIRYCLGYRDRAERRRDTQKCMGRDERGTEIKRKRKRGRLDCEDMEKRD